MPRWSAEEAGLSPPIGGAFPKRAPMCVSNSLLNAAGVCGHLLLPRQVLGAAGFSGRTPSGTSPKPLGAARAKEKGPALGFWEDTDPRRLGPGAEVFRLKRPGPGGRRPIRLCSQLWLGTFPGGQAKKQASWAITILGEKRGKEEPSSGENSSLPRVRAQLCPTLCDPRDEPSRLLCPGILQARIRTCTALFSSRGSSN